MCFITDCLSKLHLSWQTLGALWLVDTEYCPHFYSFFWSKFFFGRGNRVSIVKARPQTLLPKTQKSKNPKPRGLGLTLKSYGPPTHSSKKISGGQPEEGHGVVHHVQWEHHQSYFLYHYQNASIQGRQIQCRKDQMQISHVEKYNVEQSSTVLNSQFIRST